MSAPFRTVSGGLVDRSRPIAFAFDGRRFEGLAGDTLASALLANGVHLLGRSFKYHRPRGLLSAGAAEPNALVELDRGPGRRDPNHPATTVELFDGLVARSQNRWPSLGLDLGAVNSLLSLLIPAGFYYKTFLWPRAGWAGLYEPLIRRAAGLGRAPDQPDPDRYATRFDHVDVLVVGGGRAGLGAALEASSDADCRVMLCEADSRFGGRLLDRPGGVAEAGRLMAALADRPNVTMLARTTAFHGTAQRMLWLAERLTDHLGEAPAGLPRQRLRQVRAARVLIATGTEERPLVFPGNDRPAVMLASAAQRMLHRFGVLVGRRVVILSAGAPDAVGDASSELAEGLRAAGAEVELIGVSDAGLPTGTGGRARVNAITVGGRRLPCDCVLMAGGRSPSVQLWGQMGGRLAWNDTAGAPVPVGTLDEVEVRGSARGPDAGGPAAFRAFPADGGKAFVDFQNDVTADDIALALREGFRSVEHLKRYTTTGMATDQGRTSNVNAIGLAGQLLGVEPALVGTTRFRAPVSPVPFALVAGHDRGHLFEPERRTPIDPWAEERGALFEPVGAWRRARAFPRPGEDLDAAAARECRTVRATAGIFDASTLGKIDVSGPDAAEFLDRLYATPLSSLAPGRCRYAVLLREDGYVHDDGVIGRLATDRFHVTTTTGRAASVLALMEDYRQTEFPDLKVWLTSTTEQWGVIALQGPRARDILAPLVDGLDIAADSFPHMRVAEAVVAGVPARLFRVSFTGELGFEVNVPAGEALSVWSAVVARGEQLGATVYGTEAMHILRAEKGYILIGQETDGTVTPDDLGLGWAVGRRKADFVGMRSLARPDIVAPGRRQLVGLRPSGRLPDMGAQLVPGPDAGPFSAQGHVTSAYSSDAAGGPIALGLLAGGRARHGETVYATALDGSPIPCVVTAPVFLDPEGSRLHV